MLTRVDVIPVIHLDPDQSVVMETKPARNCRPVSAIRKIRKPIIEKKRRERINVSLEELKDMLLIGNAVQAKSRKPSKLEKADILEQTVQHVRELQQTLRSSCRPSSSCSEPPSDAFRRGFLVCLDAVKSFSTPNESPASSSSVPAQLLKRLEMRLNTMGNSDGVVREEKEESIGECAGQYQFPPSPRSMILDSPDAGSRHLLTSGSPVTDLMTSRSPRPDSVSPSTTAAGGSWSVTDSDSSCEMSCEEGDVLDLTSKERMRNMWRPW